MKVLVLTHSFPRFDGDSAGNFVLRLTEALATIGVESRVVAPGAPAYATEDVLNGVPVTRFRYAPRKYETLAYTGTMAQDVAASWSARFALVGLLGANFAAAVREARAFQPDVIHAHWWFPGGLVGHWAASMLNVPLIVTLHGSDLRLAKTKAVGRSLGRNVLQHATAVTTVSHWLARGTKELAPHSEPIVAPMPVSTTLFMPGGTRETKRLLFAGRLNAQKGIAYALRALAAMQDKTTMLDVVGNGGGRTEYMALADALGISSRVVFHGHKSQTEIAEFYRRATALVMPSTDEGLGLTAVEALLSETPVVAFDSGGLPDIVHHEQTGLLVPPGDIVSLAAAMDQIIAAPERARVMGEAGRMFALATFAPESAAQRYRDLYENVVNHSGR